MRAWYNRLLLQNLSDEAISLGQMSTVVKLSVKPLSKSIYQLETIRKEENDKETEQIYEEAVRILRTVEMLYDQALDHLKSAIQTGR